MSGKHPLTAQGAEMLKEELRRLKSEERPRIVEAIATARAHGDLKENAEYQAAREQQSFTEGRIMEIESKLAGAQVIDNLRALGYPGRIVPINPRYSEVAGMSCYPSLDHVPGDIPIDCVAVVLGSGQIMPMMQQASGRGVRGAWAFASGFGETDAAGAALQAELKARGKVPGYVWDVLRAMPADSHPMAMFNTAILVMEKESVFRARYDSGMGIDNYEGEHTMRGTNLEFLVRVKIIPYDPTP